MEISAEVQAKLKEFLVRIDSVVSSKYIMIEKNISDFLKAVAELDIIYNALSECMVNFDFISEWKIATASGRLILPEDDTKKIAFVFCMISNIDDKNLDLMKILEHYYSSYDDGRAAYEIFCAETLVVFRNLLLGKILNDYGTETEANEPQVPETEEADEQPAVQQMEMEEVFEEEEEVEDDRTEEEKASTEELLSGLVYMLGEVASIIRGLKRVKSSYSKHDILALISTFEIAARKDERDYFYALLTSIKNATVKVKNIKPHLLEIELIVKELLKRV